MARRTRRRQLARQHQRRQAERVQRQRKRQTTTIVVALAIALVGGVVAFVAFTGGEERPSATGASGATGTTGAPGEQVGTVEPQPGPKQVACGGTQPKTALEPKPQYDAPAQVVKSGRTYTAEIRTSCGTITLRLLADRAPETVNSFVFLAQQGFFDGQRFHRIDRSIDVIQGGDPTASGTGGPGYSIPDELTGKEAYEPGVLAMANPGPDTGGSQFFLITGTKGRGLDDQAAWTIFGRIVDGLDVAKTIQRLPIQDPSAGLEGQQPAKAVYIEKVTIAAGA